MAGRQFSFFLGPSDQAHFEAAIRKSGEIVFLNDWPRYAEPEIIASPILQQPEEQSFRILVARKIDIPNIKFNPIKGRLEYSCDVTTNPVIELSRFPFPTTDDRIRAGRLYRVDKFWSNDGKIMNKTPGFVEWGNLLYELAKKSLTKVEQGCFAGAEALELRKSGIRFDGLDIPMMVGKL